MDIRKLLMPALILLLLLAAFLGGMTVQHAFMASQLKQETALKQENELSLAVIDALTRGHAEAIEAKEWCWIRIEEKGMSLEITCTEKTVSVQARNYEGVVVFSSRFPRDKIRYEGIIEKPFTE